MGFGAQGLDGVEVLVVWGGSGSGVRASGFVGGIYGSPYQVSHVWVVQSLLIAYKQDFAAQEISVERVTR